MLIRHHLTINLLELGVTRFMASVRGSVGLFCCEYSVKFAYEGDTNKLTRE
jgi:hypothetical protein